MPATLDPRKSSDFLSSTLICLLYEGLTRCAPEGGIEPGLAKEWTISADQRVYTFTLRKSFWTDGRPVTAFDFERSWKKMIDPSFSCPSAYLLFPIKNAEKCAKKQIGPDEVGILALDSQTLQVELERPAPFFLELTAFPLFLPAPDCESISGEICNGPFKLEKPLNSGAIHLVKNTQCWNSDRIDIEKIQIQIVSDENTALEMFERGEIDWLGAPLAPLPPDSIPSLQDRLQFIPMAASTLLSFNTQEFPFQNPKIRKALSLCIDRDEIVSDILFTGQIPAERCLPPSLFGKPLPPLFEKTNLLKATILLQQALQEIGATLDDLEETTLYYKATQVDKRLAQVLQRRWKEALGFTVKIEQIDPKSLIDRLHRRDYKIALCAWISQFHDPINILERYRLSSNQKNYAGWENARFTSLVERALADLDPQERIDHLIQAEEILADEVPVFPLYHWASPSLTNPRIKQTPTTTSGGVLFEHFSIE